MYRAQNSLPSPTMDNPRLRWTRLNTSLLQRSKGQNPVVTITLGTMLLSFRYHSVISSPFGALHRRSQKAIHRLENERREQYRSWSKSPKPQNIEAQTTSIEMVCIVYIHVHVVANFNIPVHTIIILYMYMYLHV